MYKMIIVEDEYFLREGLKKLVDWQSIGIEIIATAENGKDGMDKIIEFHPDIVLTDIKMKLMDGLEMITQLNNRGIKSKYIIMSGHAVFEYAQKAIENNVAYYLLKPIQKEQLSNVAKQIVHDLNVGDNYKALTVMEETKKKFYDYHNSNLTNEYAICVITFASIGNIGIDLKLELFRKLSDFGEETIVSMENNRICIYVKNPTQNTSFFQKAKLQIEALTNKEIHIGISDYSSASSDFDKLLSQAETANSYKLYGYCEPIYFNDIKNYNKNLTSAINILNNELIRSIETRNVSQINNIVDRCFTLFDENKFRPKDIIQWINGIYFQIQNIYQNIYSSSNLSNYIHTRLVDTVNINTLGELHDEMIDTILKSIDEITLDSKHNANSNVIKEVIAYIDNHFSEDITLNKLEKAFFTESSYLSRQIKSEVGKSYIQYITEKRIEKAKFLLANTNYTISEITTNIGYSDSKHFARLFKSIVGLTPSEYRKGNEE